mgnify:CR=1 FL=1
MTDRLITYRELSQWLARGNGEVKVGISISTSFSYNFGDDEKFVSGNIFVRSWSENFWRVPLFSVCKKGIEK